MVSHAERPLTTTEVDRLTRRRDRLRDDASGALLKYGAVSVFVCGALAVVTIIASEADPLLIVIFWSALAMVFTLGTGLPSRVRYQRQATLVDDALAANRARETRINTRRVVEFEEVGDEGACYAFDAGSGRSVFVIGQQYYADDTFPNSEFAIVDVLAPDGRVADVLIMKFGDKIQPERTIPADRKLTMAIPDDLKVVDMPIDQIGR